MNFLTIDELIARYKQRVKKAEQLNTTNNKYYVEKKSIIHWLYLLKAHINPNYALSQVSANNNVYNDILFDNIEKAIGVPLNDWQREYIITGKKKMSGETIAIVLRQLLNNTAEPMDLTTKESTARYCDVALYDDQKDCYGDIILVLHNKLESAGIPVRSVKVKLSEKEQKMNRLTSNKITSNADMVRGE